MKDKVELYEALFNTAQIILLAMDSKGRITDINPYAESLFGYSLDEVKGKDWFDTFLPKRDRDKIRAVFLRAVKGDETKGNVNPIICKDGRELMIKWHDKILNDPDGRFIGLLSIGRDMTESQKTDQELRESQAKLSLITDNTRDLIAVTTLDMKATFTYVSPSYTRLLGYSKEELLGKSGFDFIHPEDKKKLTPLLIKYVTGKAQAFFTGNPKEIFEEVEYRLPTKSGKWCTMETLVSLVEGQLVHVSREVTERKKAQDTIKKEAKKWENTFNSISDLLYILDKDSRFVKVNKATCDIFKVKQEDLIGKKCYEVVHKTNQPWPNCSLTNTLKDNEVHTEEINDPNLGMYLEVTTSPLCDDQGEITGVVHLAKDITKRKKLEEEAQKRIHEMEIFYKASIGREERILELKKKVTELEEKLKK